MPALRAGKRLWTGRVSDEQMAVLHYEPFFDGDELVFEPAGAPKSKSWDLSPAAVEAMRACFEANRERVMEAWFADPNDEEGWHQDERPYAWWLFVADRPRPGSRRDEPQLVREIERRLELNERRRVARQLHKKETPK
jgi:hypothetical protein